MRRVQARYSKLGASVNLLEVFAKEASGVLPNSGFKTAAGRIECPPEAGMSGSGVHDGVSYVPR